MTVANTELYDVLGCNPDNPASIIKKAFRALAKEHHPDLNGGAASKRFNEVAAAYKVLSDPELRAEYDRPQLDLFSVFAEAFR